MISHVRRNTEVSLLVMAAVLAVGGYWLTALSKGPEVPAGLIGYALLFTGLYAAAHLAVRRFAPGADPLFLPIAAMLNSLGFVLISRLEGTTPNSPPAGAQVRWMVVAVAVFIATLIVVRDVRGLARYRYTWAAAGVLLLVLPSIPGLGREINGAQLWIRVGPLSFQPAEIAKIALVLFFAGYLAEKRELLAIARRRIGPIGIPELRFFGPVAAAWGVSLLVMINQKDLGSSMLFFGIFVVMIWVATSRPAYLLAGGLMFLAGAFFAYTAFDHVQVRIQIWQSPFAHFDGRGYQIVQSMFALATGGAWGTGLGLGRPDLIPFVQTDFIFAALGEELGLAGTTAVLTAYALFVARGFGLATRCADDFSKLLVAGLVSTFGLQTALILGGVTNLIPLTGVTLPFMSYGGSSLLSNFILVAFLIRVSDETSRQLAEGPATEIHVPAGGGR
ncbi:MAG: FtsW/RodA/SpoVE family cell cycle protein [Actinobacteria bacterium]|nr:FtsW/RodA/SpoVE family cell cycle protein [Actinomycetota bacterium]